MKAPLTALLVAATLMITAGCTWVSPSHQVKQQGVMVLPQDRVSACRLLSKTQVSVADRVGFINRPQADVEKDLQTLAMNQAVTQGGDTVSAVAPMANGAQTFGIYRCLGRDHTPTNPASATSTSAQTTPYQPPR